jgi:hypothetical protein
LATSAGRAPYSVLELSPLGPGVCLAVLDFRHPPDLGPWLAGTGHREVSDLARYGLSAAAAILSIIAGCSSGDGPTSSDLALSLTVESAELVSEGRSCRVGGTVFNHTADSTYDVLLNFEAHDATGAAIGEARALITDVPPQSRVSYLSDPLTGNGQIACSQVAELHRHDSQAVCKSGRGPGCR